MDRELYLKLSKWRDETARREHVEAYRVISTQAIEGIATRLPKTEEELLLVKGIAEKKLAQYGKEILTLVHAHSYLVTKLLSKETSDAAGTVFDESEASSGDDQLERVLSVGDYLELLNIGLRRSGAKVQGEISSLDIRARYIFFGLKDAKDGAVMNVFMWRNDYDLSGITLEEGMGVALSGFPEIYKPSGRFSFRANAVELVGEGAIKKAYDELKKKLEREGLFAEEKKRAVLEYPQTIGVITSKTGAVIHDFLNNIGKFGYKIKFYDSRVEGQLAVRDLVTGVKYFKKKKGIDVLVVMRGGGSLESLQAFNNERLVREISDCPFPVVAGIGHDKDVPLVSLVADVMVSTPTAAAKMLDRSWQEAFSILRLVEEKVFRGFGEILNQKRHGVIKQADQLEKRVTRILEYVRTLLRIFEHSSDTLQFGIERATQKIFAIQQKILSSFSEKIKERKRDTLEMERVLRRESPKRQLELGYSLVFSKGKIVRSVKGVKEGESLETRVADGTIYSKVEKGK